MHQFRKWRLTVLDEKAQAAPGVALGLALELRIGEAGLGGLEYTVGLVEEERRSARGFIFEA